MVSYGCLKDIAGDGSYIDMGIMRNARVVDCMSHRRRKHRVQMLNKIEEEIVKFRESRTPDEDVSLWKNEKGQYKKRFSTKSTWLSIREKHQLCSWYHVIWFKHATPKFSVVTWIAMRGRLATGDRIQQWNSNAAVACIFCDEPVETMHHLFFACVYSAQIWEALTRSFLTDQYTTSWERIIELLIRNLNWNTVQMFIMRYLFQSTIHAIWRERNRRRHGEESCPADVLIRRLDKNMRNQFTVIQRRGDEDYNGGMIYWFGVS